MMSKYLENVQKKFESWRSALATMQDHAVAHLKVWVAIEGFMADHVDELNIAPAFWGLTRRAHLHVGLLNLGMLVDKHPKSINLPRLLDYVEKQHELFSEGAYEEWFRAKTLFSEETIKEWIRDRKRVTHERVAQDIAVIAGFDQDVENLRGWRDKVLAHTDEDLVRRGESVDQAYPLLRSRIIEMLDIFGDTLNFYSLAYDSTSYSFGVPFESGLRTLITALAEWREAKRSRRNA